MGPECEGIGHSEIRWSQVEGVLGVWGTERSSWWLEHSEWGARRSGVGGTITKQNTRPGSLCVCARACVRVCACADMHVCESCGRLGHWVEEMRGCSSSFPPHPCPRPTSAPLPPGMSTLSHVHRKLSFENSISCGHSSPTGVPIQIRVRKPPHPDRSHTE